MGELTVMGMVIIGLTVIVLRGARRARRERLGGFPYSRNKKRHSLS